jgi:type III restriction enzyme
VQSEDVAKTAVNLADSMVNRCGFDRVSVGDVLRVHRRLEHQRTLFYSSIPMSAPPDLSNLAPTIQAKVKYEPESRTIKVHQPLTRDDAQALRDALPTPTDKAAVETYWQEEREVGTTPKRLDQYAPPIRVPQLAVRDGQQLLRLDPIELDEFAWNLDKCEPRFTAADFSDELHVGDRVLVDVTGQGAVRVGGVEEVILRQQSLFLMDDQRDKADLVRWFDWELHRGGRNAGLTAAETQAWLNRMVDWLIGERGIAVPMLDRRRHELADLVDQRIIEHGRNQVREAAKSLFASEGDRRLVTTFDMPFEVMEQCYAPYRRYTEGPFTYAKHAFDLIGDMGDEESQCAKKLDDHPNVKRWLRNLVHESAGGFSLPLSPGRFFPDFIVELKDGRIAIVEYKGGYLAEQKTELHKEEVGRLWAERSGGKGIFVWIVDMDWAKLEAALNAS